MQMSHRQLIKDFLNPEHALRHILIVDWTMLKGGDLTITHIIWVCVAPYLVEKGAVCDGDTQGSEAAANHHVIWGVVTVAAAATGQEPGHRHPAEDHSAGGTQSISERQA